MDGMSGMPMPGMSSGPINSTSPEIVNGDMNVNTINVEWIPRVYYIFIGSVVGAFSLIYMLEYLVFRQRISSFRRGIDKTSSKPKNIFWKIHATQTAIGREISNASFKPLRLGKLVVPSPTVGQFLLIAANFAFVVTLCFYKLSPSQYYQFQNIGYRCAFVSLPQLTLIFMLSARNNIIGYLTGMSYERLNYLHRWFSRTLLVTVTFHMAYFFANWAPYNYIGVMITTDPTTQRGFAAWFILLWIVFSSFAPIRGWNYEFFVVQHLISYVAFMTMVFVHTPSSDHIWIWAPVALWFLDHAWRFSRTIYNNLSLFHPQQRSKNAFSGVWACRGELVPLADGMTRITIRNPALNWVPGQHALVSCQSLIPLQNHPFTIATIPSDGKLEFLVRAHKGATQKILQYARNNASLPHTVNAPGSPSVPITIGGPYGNLRPLRQFDSVVFLTGSTGATFTVPLLRDIVREWRISAGSVQSTPRKGLSSLFKAPHGAVTRRVRFIWVVKSRSQLSWFADQLWKVLEDVKELQAVGTDVAVNVSLYVTCDPAFTAYEQSGAQLGSKQQMKETFIESHGLLAQETSSSEELSTSDSMSDKMMVSSDKLDPVTATTKEVGSALESVSSSAIAKKDIKSCGPDGTCCCQTTIIEGSSDQAGEEHMCSCCGTGISPSPSSTSDDKQATKESTVSFKNQIHLHPDVTLLSGRPHPRSLIRTALERARGETAVVACGPKGLLDDSRQSVVALSDERAVHKGTGAQGIWFWGEGFCY